ncbi:YbbR-like protein [Desulfonatronum thiosulfatophilum]|uniref:YbbR-like protein n=1 Tax=Desulfonatronum thiosulfatophilum TaxID=617002 RepID=A0A1G6D4D1_9BACT|nr:CdaR family protein [Desulfonatronum thiosulfatophilum]SDB40016.1 YbbR-like protein [Desulfonatronum thiosulfatophilum]
MRTNWQYLVLAFALALFSWHLVSGREKVDTWIQVPVEMVNMPQGFVVRQGMVHRIEVRVRGPRPMLRTIDMRNVFYPLDLAELQPGLNQLEFETRNISLSRAIEVVEISPSRAELLVDRLMTKNVPVVKQMETDLHEDYELKRAAVRPPAVVLRGPQAKVEEVDEIMTQPVTVEDDRPGKLEITVGLILPPEVEANPSRVSLQLDFGEKTTDISIEREVLVAQPAGMTVTVDPARIRLQLRAPLSMVREEKLVDAVWVTTSPLGELASGEHEVSYRVELPPGVVLLQGEPENVRVQIEQISAVPVAPDPNAP